MIKTNTLLAIDSIPESFLIRFGSRRWVRKYKKLLDSAVFMDELLRQGYWFHTMERAVMRVQLVNHAAKGGDVQRCET